MGRNKLVLVFVVGALIGATSAISIAPHVKRTELVATGTSIGGGGGPAAPGQPNPGTTTDPNAPPQITSTHGTNVDASKLTCARGSNGGATDVGVTATSINLATTTVQSGYGAAFLGDVKFAMEAVKNKVNASGGICGRLLNIQYVDDGWDPQRGAGYLRNFIKQGIFAIPVGPSSEGLNVVIKSHDFDKAGIPVVGTDGMTILQYSDPWVWPVATSTASTARLMALDAYNRGARHFSIVFDKNYKFGAEAASAYDNEVKRLTGKDVEGFNSDNNCSAAYCGILAGQPSYATEVNQFKAGDFEAMFLEPTTALTWMSTPGAPTATQVKIGGAQPLFTRDFANSCQRSCDQMQVWTSYRPPIENYANDPMIRTFQSDLAKTKPDADATNAFAEGGYAGMELLVDAMRAVGPNLTRLALKQQLDRMVFRSGLTVQPSLTWAKDHFANGTMQAFTIEYKGTFGGWQTGQIVRDPHPQLGTN